jgi:hypothetical protein
MNIILKEASAEENHRLQEAITDYNIQIVKDLPRAKAAKIDLMDGHLIKSGSVGLTQSG